MAIPKSKELNNKSFEALKGSLGYTNVMQAPRLKKVIVSAGVGSFKDKKKREITRVLFTGIIRTRFFFLLITS